MIKLRSENLTVMTKRKLLIAKAEATSDDPPETSSAKSSERKGTIVGAVSLIVGTSIGSGILALPQKTSPAVISLSPFSLVYDRNIIAFFFSPPFLPSRHVR